MFNYDIIVDGVFRLRRWLIVLLTLLLEESGDVVVDAIQWRL